MVWFYPAGVYGEEMLQSHDDEYESAFYVDCFAVRAKLFLNIGR